MSTKKRFSIAPDLASGIRNTIQSASSNSGQLHYDMMSVNVIEPDPKNPRTLALTRDDIRQGNFKEASGTKEFEAIRELAESIKRVGIRNAIEVYKEGDKYRIISGERRYLAAILANQDYIPARINQKPEEFKLRYMQWVENINREDLSLFDKYNNLLSMAEAYQRTNHIELTPQKLIEMLGVSSTQAYRYFALMRANAEVIDLIQQGKLTSLKVVEELASVKDKDRLVMLLEQIRDSERNQVSHVNYKTMVAKAKPATKLKSASSVMSLTIPTHDFAHKLFDLITTHPELRSYQAKFQNVDWTSSKSINQVFKKLFATIESDLLVDEMS